MGIDIGRVFVALAEPTRRQVLERLGRAPATASALARELPISRQAIVEQLGVLVASGLVVVEKGGGQSGGSERAPGDRRGPGPGGAGTARAGRAAAA